MQTYETQRTVSVDDLDELNHVNNIRYVEWVQDIAKTHWKNNVSPAIFNNYFWVMIKHCIEYKSAAVLNDVINLKTYIKTCEGVTSKRIVEITNTLNNTLIAKSETTWCFMDDETKRPVRIPAEIPELFI
jgi:acyl-CoA thioester hydrolase